jgi:integrase/recombinase XerC
LTFTTKYQNRQELPVTSELAALLDQCTDPTLPFVAQLHRGFSPYNGIPYGPIGRPCARASFNRRFNALKKKCGIVRDLRPHDLRRTTATRVYSATKDLRIVQALLGHSNLGSTLWYLDHHVTSVPLAELELAKLNPTTEVIQ